MSNGNKRKTGGAWRRCKTMTAMHAKPGKDRSKAKIKQDPCIGHKTALEGEIKK